MASCVHCSTEFSPAGSLERFCCRGCEFVHEWIGRNGFERFYDLKQDSTLPPARSRPFEEHDFSWVPDAVTRAETGARGGPASLDLALEGISCVGCVWLVEKLFSRHPGAISAAAHPAGGRLHLEWQPGACDLEPFFRELCRFGYVAAPAGTIPSARSGSLGLRTGLCGAFALNAMGFSLPGYLGMPADFEFAGLFRMIAFLSATLSMLVGASYFCGRAWRALKSGTLHLDLPISLGLIAAYTGSIAGWALGRDSLAYFDFVSTFVFLMLVGRRLQTHAVEKNRLRLVRRQPVPETLECPGTETPLPRAGLAEGVSFRLQPGHACPVASVLQAGEADFSLEWIHGEADPVKFTAGTRVPSGAILLSRQPAALEAAESWEQSQLAKLTALPSADRGSPALMRLLRVYLLVVLVLGTGTFAWWAWHGLPVSGLQAMISVFVVSCPCALGVSVPLADDLAAARMERAGVFVRNGSLWSRLRQVKQVIFDKTGTLTLERPVLENPETVQTLPAEALRALALLTQGSFHPAARALLEASGSRGQDLLEGIARPAVREFPGLGVVMNHEGSRWSLGRAGWDGSETPAARETPGSELRKDGQTLACFSFRDAPRPGARATVADLRRRNLTLSILSGDHPDKVASLAANLGIPAAEARGGLSPEEKAGIVKRIDRQDSLYLGDGANDSLAFDRAWVTGTPVVDRSLLEAKADFYTLGSGLRFLGPLLDTAAHRRAAVRDAFAFALVYNVAVVAASAAGHMNPLLAAILMPLSSIASLAIVATRLRPIRTEG